MPYIVEMMKVSCTSCPQETWALIRSKEEHDAFKCASCSQNTNSSNPIKEENSN